MSIIRVRKDKGYFAASNKPFNDNNLSWEARGVMGYLLSKPDDWQLQFTDLVKQSNAGDHKVRRILKELQDNGYLTRKRLQDEEGKIFWVSTIYETPTISRKSPDGSQDMGGKKQDTPTSGKTISRLSTRGKPQDLISTDVLNTEEDLKTPGADTPEQPKPKTEYVQAMEELEETFANTRGCPLPDWEGDPRASQKRWRTPLKKIWERCNKDTDTAVVVVRQVVRQMRIEKLTFDAPDQIEKTAYSHIIDMKPSPNGNLGGLRPGETEKEYGERLRREMEDAQPIDLR